ncbi:MAG TPA: GNAT family N-acetyltransferase [Candidatus Stackebrandtia faecavium]|nr:GNAT family N-acetyltransferase [Candidatus Stackebrandtia faecavium]
MRIRACRDRDVQKLDEFNPSANVESRHRQRFAQQRDGEATYLLAWHGSRIFGHALVLWRGGKEPPVREAYPDCPEINALEIFPPTLRGKGLGSALIAACEREIAAAGYGQVGLGVERDNVEAARLYRRLGYSGDLQYRDHYDALDSMGTRHHFADECTFLVKSLDSG